MTHEDAHISQFLVMFFSCKVSWGQAEKGKAVVVVHHGPWLLCSSCDWRRVLAEEGNLVCAHGDHRAASAEFTAPFTAARTCYLVQPGVHRALSTASAMLTPWPQLHKAALASHRQGLKRM